MKTNIIVQQDQLYLYKRNNHWQVNTMVIAFVKPIKVN